MSHELRMLAISSSTKPTASVSNALGFSKTSSTEAARIIA